MWDLSRGPAMQYRAATATILWSTLFELLEALYFPRATFRAAGLAFQPCLRLPPYVARQEIAAEDSALVIGRRERRDVAAGAGVGIRPRDAAVFAAARERICGNRTSISEVSFRQCASGRHGPGLLNLGIGFFKHCVERKRTAANGDCVEHR